MRLKVTTGILLFVFTLLGYSQQPAYSQQPVQVPRSVMLFFEPVQGAELSDENMLLLYETLLMKLELDVRDIVVFEHADVRAIPATDLGKSRSAQEAGADAWLWVAVGGSPNALEIEVRSLDLLKEEETLRLELKKADLLGLDRQFWDEITEAVKSRYPKVEQRIIDRKIDVAEVVFQVLPGTKIHGLTDQPLVADSAGEVSVELLQSAVYSLRAIRDGYYPVTRSIYVDEPKMIVPLKQQAGSRFALDFFLNNLTYPGFEASFYIIPNYFYLRFGFNTFVIGLPFRNFLEGDRIGYSLTHLNLAAGVYFNQPDHVFRFYFSGGMFLRINHIMDSGLGIDPISSIGLFPSVGIEVSTLPRLRLFFEYRPLLYLTRYPDLMAASYLKSKYEGGTTATQNRVDAPPYIFLDGAVIDPVNINIGLRIQL